MHTNCKPVATSLVILTWLLAFGCSRAEAQATLASGHFLQLIITRSYHRQIQSLQEINIPENYMNEYILTSMEIKRDVLSDIIRQKQLVYISENDVKIIIKMALFSTPEEAMNGLIATAKYYRENEEGRYWLPWEYTRVIPIGDMYAPGVGSASLFTRNNVLIDITADFSVAADRTASIALIESIAEEIDMEISQSELEFIINNMVFEEYNNLIRSLHEINLPENFPVMSACWPPHLPEEFEYYLHESESTDTYRHLIYLEQKRRNRIIVTVTLFSAPEDARKSVLMEVLRRNFRLLTERETIGDISVWDSHGILFSRANATVRLFSTAINPAHEVLPFIQEIDGEILNRTMHPIH